MRSRLGIPITIATDPRHGTENNPGAALYTPSFSQWPSSLGLAATRDTLLVREFGDIARQEYNAVSIRLGLFDNPYVNEKEALKTAEKKEFREKGKIAQAKSTVLLKNDNLLPLAKGTKIYTDGMLTPHVLNKYGEVVNDPAMPM